VKLTWGGVTPSLGAARVGQLVCVKKECKWQPGRKKKGVDGCGFNKPIPQSGGENGRGGRPLEKIEGGKKNTTGNLMWDVRGPCGNAVLGGEVVINSFDRGFPFKKGQWPVSRGTRKKRGGV